MKDIIEPTKKLTDGEIIEYDIQPIDFSYNVRELSRILRNNDLIIVAGGDGTASIAANAALKSDASGTRLAVFAYGNFNDFQSNFRLKKRALKRILTGKSGVLTVRPAEISLDGVFWRFATLYFTAGLLAKSTQVFEKPKVRAAITEKSRLPRLIYSLWKLAGWFIHERRQIYSVNGQKATDFGVLVGQKMARVLRNRDNHRLQSWQIGTFRLRLTNLFKAGSFVLGSMLFGLKTEPLDEIEWKLAYKHNTIWLQTEGEGLEVKNIRTISARKSDKTIDFVV